MPKSSVEIKKTPAPGPAAPDLWQSFRGEMDRLFDRFDGGFRLPSLRRLFESEPTPQPETRFEFTVPSIDLAEDDAAYKLTAELPGLDQKDVEVSISGDRLVLKGEKRQEKEEKDKNYYLSERSYGAFLRSLPLPEGVDRDKIDATVAKGVLTVTLPKTEAAQQKQKKIEVKSA